MKSTRLATTLVALSLGGCSAAGDEGTDGGEGQTGSGDTGGDGGENGFPPQPCGGALPLSIVLDLETMGIEWVNYSWYGGTEGTIADDILLVVQAING